MTQWSWKKAGKGALIGAAAGAGIAVLTVVMFVALRALSDALIPIMGVDGGMIATLAIFMGALMAAVLAFLHGTTPGPRP